MVTELWKQIGDTKYYVSNFGRFIKKNPKHGYRFIKPFRRRNKYAIKINYKTTTCARLVANAFIRPLEANECVYHKNGLEWDNFYRNLLILSKKELGERTGYISRSKRIVQVKDGEIINEYRSARECGEALFINYQSVLDYCDKKVKKPLFNLMYEDDYWETAIPPFEWEHKRGRGRPKKN